MFSFARLAVLSALAFGTLSSALPIDLPIVGSLPAPVDGVVDTAVGVAGGAINTVQDLTGLDVLRRDGVPGVASILSDATAALVPATNLLKFVTAQNATVEALSAPVDEIKTILSGAVSSLQALVGQPVEVILASVDGTAQITVAELAPIVGGLLTIVLQAVGAVMTVVGATVNGEVTTLLRTVGGLVAELLSVVLSLVGSLVGSLLATLLPIIGGLIPLILNLNVASLISLLGL